MTKLTQTTLEVATLTLIILSMAELAFANPFMPTSFVNVESPVDNQIYFTNNVELKTSQFQRNCTVKYYVLDDQAPVSTNGSKVMSNLSPGTHILKLYGTQTLQGSNSTYEQNATLGIIYFSVYYSQAWVIFIVILALVSGVTSFILFKKHGQIKAAFEGKKSNKFVVGLLLLLFFFLPTSVFAWSIASTYLFPVWYIGLELLSIVGFVVSLFFLGLGLLLMWFGKDKKRRLNQAN